MNYSEGKSKSIKRLVLSMTLVIVLSAVILSCGASKDGTNKNKSDIVLNNANKVEYIYDVTNIPDSELNKVNKKYGSLMYMNKDMLRLNWETLIGSSSGKLVVRPTKLSYYLNIEDDINTTYKINIKENKYLIPLDISTIDENRMQSSTTQVYYVIDTMLNFNKVVLSIESLNNEKAAKDKEWVTVAEDRDAKAIIDSYFNLNAKYMLHLNIESDIALKDKALKLMENILSIISIEKQEYSSEDNFVETYKQNIQLSDKISLNIEEAKITRWHSGAESLVGKEFAGNSYLTFNVDKEWTTLVEYGQDVELQNTLNSLGINLVEYKYNGDDIYLGIPKSDSILSTNNISVFFNVDNTWYEIYSTLEYDSKKQDEYIDYLITSILTWK